MLKVKFVKCYSTINLCPSLFTINKPYNTNIISLSMSKKIYAKRFLLILDTLVFFCYIIFIDF